jgi:1-acyl-sn-glycerol-3-phosphate acyltransferase
MRQSDLFRTRRFLPLFATQFLTAFNDNFLKNAIVILVSFHGYSAMGLSPAEAVALSSGVFILPFFLFSAQAGQLADQREKSRIIRWVKAIEIAVMAIAGYGFLAGGFPWLLAALFLMGLHSTVFGPIKYGCLPQLLRDDEIVAGNALIEAGTFLAILLGTIGGGVIVGASASGPLHVTITLLVVAVLGFATSLAIPDLPPADPGARIGLSPFGPAVEVVRAIAKNRTVFLSILGISWFWFFGAAMLSLFPSYARDVLRAGEGVVTLFLAVFSVGIALGSLFCEKLSRERLELGLVPLGSIGMTACVGALSFLPQPPSTVALASVGDFLRSPEGARITAVLFALALFSGFYIVPLNTVVQVRAEASHRSRVIAGNNILNALFMVFASLLLIASFRSGMDAKDVFLTLAAENFIVAIYIYGLIPEFLLRFLAYCLANVMYRLRVRGHSNIPAEGPGLLICNHVSFVDWLIIAAGVKRPVRFVMDHAFAKGPMRWLVRDAKIIPIARAKENAETLKRAFERIAKELRDGNLVCIFPEGKITADGRMNPFRPGVERILAETPVPVVPMALRNMWGSLFSRYGGKAILKKPRRFWARVELEIGPPIAAADAHLARLTEAVTKLLVGDKGESGLSESPGGKSLAKRTEQEG